MNPRRLLVVEKHFVQGFGGTPESVLLLAQHLAPRDINVDVMSAEGVLRDAGSVKTLPYAGSTDFEPKDAFDLDDYQALLIAGSWNLTAAGMALKARRYGMAISYAAKGNLCSVEFRRPRDLKKLLYLLTVEAVPLVLSRRLIFSSNLERRSALLPPFIKRRGVVIAEPFKGPVGYLPARPVREEDPSMPLTFGFLAEISPRKGLKEFVCGFLRWMEEGHHVVYPKLRIAGDVRPGSDRYLRETIRITKRHPYGNQITWEPGKRADARDEFYREIDVFVCPSRFESFGLTPLEALWEGVPVICGQRIGCLEHLPQLSACFTFPNLTSKGITASLRDFATQIEEARKSAINSQGVIIGTFSSEELVSQFLETIFDEPQSKALA